MASSELRLTDEELGVLDAAVAAISRRANMVGAIKDRHYRGGLEHLAIDFEADQALTCHTCASNCDTKCLGTCKDDCAGTCKGDCSNTYA